MYCNLSCLGWEICRFLALADELRKEAVETVKQVKMAEQFPCF